MATRQKLTDAVVKRLPTPAAGNAITWDTVVTGFGARVTAAGHRALVLDYRTRGGRKRRFTIGSFGDWSVTGGREEARKLRRLVDAGGDPLAELSAERGAPIVNDLIERFLAEHVGRKAPNTQVSYRMGIERHVRPALGRSKVSEVAWADIAALHRKVTTTAGATLANRVVAVTSKMFALAVRWRMRSDSPCKGIELNPETKRKRYATADELKRLTAALDEHEDQQAVNILRICLFTGCRVGEAMAARWCDFDLTAGKWTKPAALVKQRVDHAVPLSTPAKKLLAELQRKTNGFWVFSANSASGHRVSVQKSWLAICKVAKINGLRVHDLRHSFASQLASSGASLPLIGSLLGHTSPATTHRYAHLFDDPQRAAVERVGAIISGAGKLTKGSRS